ncbi:MAG: prepilin-type N-terminal cleavage/methylation domain-containing protein [Candidatus Omnitrophota bacterium]
MKDKGFTLIELIVVIIVIGVLVTLTFTHYGSYTERALNKEAQANLRLIIAAERNTRVETGDYYASDSTQPTAINNINTNLRLSLSAATNRKWDYVTTVDNAADPPTCCAQATRNGDDSRTYRIRDTEDNPVADGTCP